MKIKITESQYSKILESIRASDAYTYKTSIDTVANGLRNVGVVSSQEKKAFPYIMKAGLDFLTVPQGGSSELIIFYNKDGYENATKLYQIAKKRNGYLNDQSPSEAMQIGRLLDYNEDDILEYINRRYNKNEKN